MGKVSILFYFIYSGITSTFSTNYAIFRTYSALPNNSVNYEYYFPISDEIIHFKVKTSNDAYISLTTEPHESNPMYEILIAAYGNQYSYIRKNRVKKESGEVVVATNGLVSRNEFRGFWIELDYTHDSKGQRKMTISIGCEGEVLPFMTRKDDAPFTIRFFGLASYHAHGFWKFKEITPVKTKTVLRHQMFVQTTNKAGITPSYAHFYDIHNKTIQFKVQAGHDAWVAITSEQQTTHPMIEILFGGWDNSKTVIKKNGSIVASVATPGILSAQEYRGFWISLDYTYGDEKTKYPKGVLSIQVGRELKSDALVTWLDPIPYPANYFSIATTRYGEHGYWVLEDIPTGTGGQDIIKSLTTWGTNKYRFMPIVSNRIIFQVRAKQDVFLALTTKPESLDPYIEIILGGSDNKRSSIRKDGTTQVLYEGEILDENNFRRFWIQYDYLARPSSNPSDRPVLMIRVGFGSEPVPFLTWSDPKPFPVNYFGFTTFHKSVGEWVVEGSSSIPEYSSFQDYTFTHGDCQYRFYPTSTNLVSFRVLANDSAAIALSNTPDMQEKIVEIILGGSKTEKTLLKFKGNEIKSVKGSVLHPKKYRSFWIEWDYIHDNDNNPAVLIKIGRKDDEKAFLSWINPTIFPVNFFGVSTCNNENATWIMSHIKHTESEAVGAYYETVCTALIVNVTDEREFGWQSSSYNGPTNNNDDDDKASAYEKCLSEPVKTECVPPDPVLVPVYVRYLFNKERQQCETIRWSSEELCEVQPPNVFNYREDCKRTCMYPRDEYPELIYPDVMKLLL